MHVIIPGPPPARFENPLRVLRARTPDEAVAALAAAQEALEGGLYCAGYLSYELGAALNARRPRAGELPLLALGFYDRLHASAADAPSAHYRLGPLRSRVDRSAYDKSIQTIARAIYDGDVYQINYTVPFDFAFSGNPYALFAELCNAARVEHAAYVKDGATAILSISPESFLEIKEGSIFAKPMKGTAPLDRASELGNPKNRAEHVMIVDLLRNDLHRICWDVEVPSLFEIETYPTFTTMTSTIRGRLRAGVTIAEILRATYPCGSVTGAPKRAAMNMIERLEPDARGVYTGSIGYFGPDGSARWNVAIRTLQIDCARSRGRLDIGGGIVADSQADAEWEEIALKGRFVESLITPFELLETFAAGSPQDHLEAHLARLRRSAKHFGIPLDEPAIGSLVAGAGRARGSLLRLRVGWNGEPSLRAEPASPPRTPVKVQIASRAVLSRDPLLAHKTSWRDAYDSAFSRAQRAGCFDALCTNERDELTEGTRTSLFVEIEGVLYTPPMSCGLLPGILRERLLAQGRCRERVLYEEDLQGARAFFVGNSARGLLRAELTKELSGV